MRRPLCAFAFLVACLACCADGPEAAGQPAAPVRLDRRKVEPYIAVLRVLRENQGLEASATGFVIADADKKQWIVTCAHIFQSADPRNKVASVTYFLPGMEKPAPCKSVRIDEKNDLALLELNANVKEQHPAGGLPVFNPKKDAAPQVDDTVFTLGSPGGLSWSLEKGELNANPLTLTIGGLKNALWVKQEKFGRLDAQLELWRHNTILTGGYSGSPMLTADGQVLGIQMSTLPESPNVSFAVHFNHLAKFDRGLKPRDLAKEPVVVLGNDVLVMKGAKGAKPPPPPKIKVGKQEVEAGFAHLGYVEGKAEKVIERYVQDRERFLSLYTAKRLQDVMNQPKKLAHITNTTLGMRLLVPQGYEYSFGRNESKDGLVLELSPPKTEKVVAPYDQPLRVAVFHAPEEFEKKKAEFSKLLAAGKIKAGTDRATWVKDELTDSCVKDVVLNGLNLRVRFPDGSEEGKKENPVFLVNGYNKDAAFSWIRWNFDHPDKDNDLCYAVHIGFREPVMAVTIYKFRKQDRDTLNKKPQPQPFPAGVPHYALIAATVSLY